MKIIITEEQNEKLNRKIKSTIEKYGIEHAMNLFGDKGIIKRIYQNNPSEFLDQFNDLTPVEKDDRIYYVDKDRLPLFVYYPGKKNNYVYINYDRIWLFFSVVIGLERSEIIEIMNNWLEETYNLKGLTPIVIVSIPIQPLEETYNIK